MDIERVNATQSSFFDDLEPPKTSSWIGYEVSVPTFNEIGELAWVWFAWAVEEASRFGELGEEMTVIRGVVDDSGEVFKGIVGEREINRKVRVTGINGIQTSREHAIRIWEKISKLFTTRVHFVYNETKGSVASDGANAVWDKYVRSNPKTVKALAEHWESLLEEMGDGGLIYHIAHSHGALLTTQAADLVSPEVRSRLVIRTFGAFQSPHQRDFADIKNIVCPDDPVIWLNNFEDDSTVVRVQGSPELTWFIKDPHAFFYENHLLTQGPYWRYLEEIERYNFREKYESYSSKMTAWVSSLWKGPQASE